MRVLLRFLCIRQRELAERLAEIAHATQELHQSADVVADSAQAQSQASASAAAAVEEMSQSIEDVARSALRSEEASSMSLRLVEQGNASLAQLAKAIDAMATCADETAQVMQALENNSRLINQMSDS